MKTVEGLTLDFEQESLSQKTKVISSEVPQKVMLKINELAPKGVIEQTEHKKGEFISPIFFLSKSAGTSRLILNLDTLNEFLGHKWRHYIQ